MKQDKHNQQEEANSKTQNRQEKTELKTTAAEINNLISGATDKARATAGKEKAIEGTDVNFNKKSI